MSSNLDWKQTRKLLKFFEPSIKQHPDWPVIITEGDSWLSFPIHANTVDFLDEWSDRKISLLRLESSGDEALRIIGGKQKAKLAKFLERYPVQALIFSGGGNDVVGSDLLSLLNKKTPAMTWQECVNETTTAARFERLKSAYLDLLHLRDEERPNCVLYVHCYDWAIPSGRGAVMWGIKVGPWMRQHLEAKGINDPDDQRKIIRHLLERFRDLMVGVAQHPNVVMVDTLGTLKETEWNDELHPTRKGFEKIARKFRDRLKIQFPSTF